MKKISVVAPANIAFIKYWGKQSDELRIPLNDSISMNISGATTTTTVECDPILTCDKISFLGESISDKENERIIHQLDKIRNIARKNIFAHVATKNSFPKGTGIASSASGFAALTMAATKAMGLELTEKELTILARLGSGSACRSIPDGFSWWHTGNTSSESYAESLFPSTWWNLCDILCIVSKEAKKISSSEGMDGIRTSLHWQDRVQRIPKRIEQVTSALHERNIDQLGIQIEEDCLDMHHVMQTQQPPLYYWNKVTEDIMQSVISWRKQWIPVYFTIDAGPNVHLICEEKCATQVKEKCTHIQGIQSIVSNKVAKGAQYTKDHLF